jgi:hypothetical protein
MLKILIEFFCEEKNGNNKNIFHLLKWKFEKQLFLQQTYVEIAKVLRYIVLNLN